MNTSTLATETPLATDVKVTAQTLVVYLRDGRILTIPLSWYPRLSEGTTAERRRWKLIGPGIGIHWPDLDEDVSVEALLNGLRSNEGASSLQRWRALRARPADRTPQTKRRAPQRAKSKPLSRAARG